MACSHKWIPCTWYWDEDREQIPNLWLECHFCREKKLVVLTPIVTRKVLI